ncbi:hypothetical protein BD311DRAFT_603832, partial [Dichomitus squalens]
TGGGLSVQFQPKSILPPYPLMCGGKPSRMDCMAHSAPNALGFAVPRSVLKMCTCGHF